MLVLPIDKSKRDILVAAMGLRAGKRKNKVSKVYVTEGWYKNGIYHETMRHELEMEDDDPYVIDVLEASKQLVRGILRASHIYNTLFLRDPNNISVPMESSKRLSDYGISSGGIIALGTDIR